MPGMCGRYASFLPPEAVARFFRTTNALPNIGPSWNVAPSQQAMVVRRHPETGERHLDLLQWGLLPYWIKEPAQARRPINARVEAIATSSMFRQAFAKRRALVPAGAFYGWRKTRIAKQPFAIARSDGEPLAFAGLWEGYRWPSGEVTRSFCVITTEPNALTVPIHDRMPAVLEPADWPVWLGEADGDPVALLRPAADDVLRAWPISTRVNAPRNNTPDLLDELEPSFAD
jgi:putative SOS response-associated peptidase YedK